MESKVKRINGYDLILTKYTRAGKKLNLVGLEGLGKAWGMSLSDLTHQYYAILGPHSVIYRYPTSISDGDVDGIPVDDLLELTTGLCPKFPKVRDWIKSATLEVLSFV